MSPLGLFEVLPTELREQVYVTLYQAYIIHCCCCPQLHKTVVYDQNDENVDSCLVNGYNCANHDFAPILRQGNWSAMTINDNSRGSAGYNPFTFLLSSKTIWLEAEPIAWQNLTLSIGIPQFKSFFEAYLSKPVRSVQPEIPRFQMLKNLHVSLPHSDTLTAHINRSKVSHGLSGYFLIGQVSDESFGRLGKCSNLTNLTITMPPPEKMVGQELRSFWSPLVYYMSQRLARLDVYIARVGHGFIEGDKAYLDQIEDSDGNPRRWIWGAMMVAAQETLTGVPEPVLPLAELDLVDVGVEFGKAAGVCFEAIKYSGFLSERVRSFRNRACWYLKS